MILFITIVLIIVNLLRPKSNFWFVITFIWMWILMSFSTGIADERSYRIIYNNPTYYGNLEIIYTFLTSIFKSMQFSFDAYKCTLSFFELLLISYTIRKHCSFPNCILSLYFIFPFAMDVVQMRNFLATSVMIYSSSFLLDDLKKNYTTHKMLNKNELLFLVGIIISSFIHSASILWVLLLLAKKFSLKNTIFFTLGVNIISYFTLAPQFIIRIASFFGAKDRIGAYLGAAYITTNQSMLRWAMFRFVIYAIGMLTVCYILQRLMPERKLDCRFWFWIKINVIVLSVVALMVRYTVELYRIQVDLSILNYMLFAELNKFYPKDQKAHVVVFNRKGVLPMFMMCMVVSISFVLLIFIGNRETVLFPILKGNKFLDLIF